MRRFGSCCPNHPLLVQFPPEIHLDGSWLVNLSTSYTQLTSNILVLFVFVVVLFVVYISHQIKETVHARLLLPLLYGQVGSQ